MTVTYDTELSNFKFWAGAVETINYMTDQEINSFEDFFQTNNSECYINDFFWFQRDFIAETLGYEDFEDMMESRRSIVNG